MGVVGLFAAEANGFFSSQRRVAHSRWATQRVLVPRVVQGCRAGQPSWLVEQETRRKNVASPTKKKKQPNSMRKALSRRARPVNFCFKGHKEGLLCQVRSRAQLPHLKLTTTLNDDWRE